jgi:hypothetical protein
MTHTPARLAASSRDAASSLLLSPPLRYKTGRPPRAPYSAHASVRAPTVSCPVGERVASSSTVSSKRDNVSSSPAQPDQRQDHGKRDEGDTIHSSDHPARAARPLTRTSPIRECRAGRGRGQRRWGVTGYNVTDDGGYRREIRRSAHYGGSGVFTSVEDLARWDKCATTPWEAPSSPSSWFRRGASTTPKPTAPSAGLGRVREPSHALVRGGAPLRVQRPHRPVAGRRPLRDRVVKPRNRVTGSCGQDAGGRIRVADG